MSGTRRSACLGATGSAVVGLGAALLVVMTTAALSASPRLLAVTGFSAAAQMPNTEYNANFTFVRVQFDIGLGRGFGRGGGEPPWAHDYPTAERNFARILDETTLIKPYLDGSNIYRTDDPEIFKYPIAYFSEPGYWRPSQPEIEGFRNYLLKGGFAIFDDFRGQDLRVFAASMRQVLPDHDLHQLDVSHQVFDSFFRIESLDFQLPTGGRGGGGGGRRGFATYDTPIYFGVFENNDPAERLMVIANYNNDIGDYWEWSDAGFVPIDLSNEAYKLGVNYVVYAMTH